MGARLEQEARYSACRRPMVLGLTRDRHAQFPGGTQERIDAVVYCTGKCTVRVWLLKLCSFVHVDATHAL